MRYHFTYISLAFEKKTVAITVEDMEKLEISYFADRDIK